MILAILANHLDLGQAARLCSLVTGKDGKDHQQQRIRVKFFLLERISCLRRLDNKCS